MNTIREVAIISAGCIVAIWIVYPLVIGLIARSKRRATPHPGSSVGGKAPSVSIIIATCDDAPSVRTRIADCLRAAPRGVSAFEVVVSLDARGSRTAPEDVSPPENVKIVRGDDPGGKAAALNAGVRAAAGDVLVFTDVHQRFEPAAVDRLVAAFADAGVGAASGRLELAPTARRSVIGRYWSYERWLRRCEGLIHSCVGATGAIWAVRRSLWSPLPPELILDDVYTPMRVVLGGNRVVFVDDARATDLREADRGHEFRRKVRTLTGVLQLCIWLPALLVPLRNPIWPQFVCHKLLRLLTPYWLIALGASFGAMVVRWIESSPALATVPLFATAAATAVSKARVWRVAREMLLWGLMLQAAVVMAAMNGVRRRWDVWHPQ